MTIYCMVTTKASEHYTVPALKSFIACTKLNGDDQFILIDNDSSVTLPSNFLTSRITLTSNPSPLGFAENMNLGIKMALEDKTNVVLLNNDIIFTPFWNEHFFQNQERIISPLSSREMKYESGSFIATNPMSLDGYIGHESALEEIAQYHRHKYSGFLNVFAVPFFATGIPYPILKKVGLLDEDFGKGGGEDYDFCLRAILEGFLVHYDMSAYILHFGGKSSWSGVESSEDQSIRESKFTSHFQSKWGTRLTDVVLKDYIEQIEQDPEMSKLIADKNYKEVILKLRG